MESRGKKREIGIYGYTCVVEKNQEKKETKKKKRNVWMIKRKKGKII